MMMGDKVMNRLKQEENAQRKLIADMEFFWHLVEMNKQTKNAPEKQTKPKASPEHQEYKLFEKDRDEEAMNNLVDDILCPVERSGSRTEELPILESLSELIDTLPTFLQRNIDLMRYQHLSLLQKHCIPIAFNGLDLLCCSQTVSTILFVCT